MSDPNPNPTDLDANQIFQLAFDQVTQRIRVDAEITATIGVLEVDIKAATDNIAIQNSNNGYQLLINPDGSINTNVTFPSTIAVTQATSPWVISATSLPLPTGAATSALQTSGNTSLSTIVTNTTGLATSANQTNGNQKTQVTNFPATQPISGTVTANAGTGIFQTNISQVGGTSISLGQEPASSSIPVVTQADATPATQNITTQDLVSTSTTGANGQLFITGIPTAGSSGTFSLSSFESIEVQVTGTWTGTLQTEVSMDGGTTWFTRGLKQTGAAYLSSSFTSNFEGGCNFGGMTNCRVRAVNAMTGTAIVRVVGSVNPASIIVSNPLTLRDSTIQSVANTIKAANTATVATDTSLVVALSPNSSLPTGSNVIGQVTANAGTNLNTSLLALQTGSNPFLDHQGSGSISSGSGSIVATTNGCSTITFTTSGTWSTAAMLIEGTSDGGATWVPLSFNIVDGPVITAFTTNNTYIVACGGFNEVRLVPYLGIWTSGTLTATWDASSGVNLIPNNYLLSQIVTNTGTSATDYTSTGTITASGTGAGSSVSITGQGVYTISASITGTFAATLIAEGQLADNTWIELPMYIVQTSTPYPQTFTVTTPATVIITGGGYLNIRIRSTAYTSGTVSVALDGSVSQQTVFSAQLGKWSTNVAGNTYSHVTSSKLVKTGAGVLNKLVVNTWTASTIITIYDNTAASGTAIAIINAANAVPQTLHYDVSFLTGLYISLSGGACDLTISYQ